MFALTFSNQFEIDTIERHYHKLSVKRVSSCAEARVESPKIALNQWSLW